jgi:hypothetical protein
MTKRYQIAGVSPHQFSPDPLALTLGQLCAITGFSTRLVDVEICTGRLPVRWRGGRALFSMDDAKRYLRPEPPGAADDKSRHVERAARQLRATAYHEAGHAVASWAMTRELGDSNLPNFFWVLIRRPDETASPYIDGNNQKHWCLGFVEGRRHYDPTEIESSVVLLTHPERQTLIEMRQRKMEAEVISLFAGPMAEARFGAHSLSAVMNYWGAQDYETARRAAADFAFGNDLWSLMDALWDRTVALMGRPDVWGAVEALAGELLQHWAIDRDRAVEIIDSAAGWKPVGGEEVGTLSRS